MKRREILMLLIPSFIFALAWVGFSIYHNFITSTIPENVSTQISPITPDFDSKTIADIKQRKNVVPLYELTASIVTPSPTPETIQPTPAISSNSAQQATSGGTLSQ